jgi:deazaflavin-dependent oxidoreductase (nitroreductase family)
MDDAIRRALQRRNLIDITTTGRRTGEPRRIEIVFHSFDGRTFIAGMPSTRKRSWIANLEDNPGLTFHLKGNAGSPVADLPAKARVITDETERREVFAKIIDSAWRQQDLETMVRWSPLIEVTFDQLAA